MAKLSMLSVAAAACLFTAPALAQTAATPAQNPACQQTKHIAGQAPANTMSSKTSMAATTSDAGNLGPGASSASIATGRTDKTGDNSPCVPGISGNGASGALPQSGTKPAQ